MSLGSLREFYQEGLRKGFYSFVDFFVYHLGLPDVLSREYSDAVSSFMTKEFNSEMDQFLFFFEFVSKMDRSYLLQEIFQERVAQCIIGMDNLIEVFSIIDSDKRIIPYLPSNNLELHSYVKIYEILYLNAGLGYYAKRIEENFWPVRVTAFDKNEKLEGTYTDIEKASVYSSLHYGSTANSVFIECISYGNSEFDLIGILAFCYSIEYIVLIGEYDTCATPEMYRCIEQFYTLHHRIELPNFKFVNDDIKVYIIRDDETYNRIIKNCFEKCIFRSKRCTLQHCKFVVALYCRGVRSVRSVYLKLIETEFHAISRKTIRWIMKTCEEEA